MVMRNAMFCSQNMPKHKEMVHLLQSITVQRLNNDTVKTGTAFWKHFFHEHVKPSYLQQNQIKAISLNSKTFSSHQGINLQDITQVWI